jgi:putative holliday junction resolvase
MRKLRSVSLAGCGAAEVQTAGSFFDSDAAMENRAKQHRAMENRAKQNRAMENRAEQPRASENRAMADKQDDIHGSVLAFDFGAKRIGVAVGDTRLCIAHPLATIAVEDNRRRFEAIARLVDEWQPVRFVLGYPASSSLEPHPLLPALQRFERRLGARFGVPVERVDESLSSWDASRRLSAAGRPAREQKPHLDAMAACVILESWFEGSRLPAPTECGGGA